jgi:cellulose synthase/poly-beta-1,6-N-acetylglucosamine synthase-like glycosyltransferase
MVLSGLLNSVTIFGYSIVDFLSPYYIRYQSILIPTHYALELAFSVFLYLMMLISLAYVVLIIIAWMPKHKKQELPLDFTNAPYVTIQIPTRNELVALDCAKCCLEFDYPKNKYEILIGDDSDQPDVSRQLVDFAKLHENVRVIKRESNVGYKPGNLNNMIQYSNGEILVLFDSDFTPGKDFLKRIVVPFTEDAEVAAVQARWNFINFEQNLVSILASTIVCTFHQTVLAFMHYFDTASLCGSAEAVRKKDLIELGSWRSGCLTEDVEYALRLHKANKKLVYLPNLECYSIVPFKPMDLYKQQMRWAYGVVSSYWLHIGDIFSSKILTLKHKLLTLCAGFGYLLPMYILMLFTLGILSSLTEVPSPMNVPLLFSQISWNILTTSGLLFASFFSLYRIKKFRYIFKMLISSFSYGLVTTYYVNKGIFKALFNSHMDWFLLNKDVKSAPSAVN